MNKIQPVTSKIFLLNISIYFVYAFNSLFIIFFAGDGIRAKQEKSKHYPFSSILPRTPRANESHSTEFLFSVKTDELLPILVPPSYHNRGAALHLKVHIALLAVVLFYLLGNLIHSTWAYNSIFIILNL